MTFPGLQKQFSVVKVTNTVCIIPKKTKDNMHFVAVCPVNLQPLYGTQDQLQRSPSKIEYSPYKK